MTLGQEFGAYAVMIGDGVRHLEQASAELLKVNMGATAIGTGINSPFGYAELCTQRLAEINGLPVTLAGDLVEATQDSGEFAFDEQRDEDCRSATIQNLQRSALAFVWSALRTLRTPPARDAARLLHHARQSEPCDPRGR
jgi:hypothetical protein